MFPYGFRALSPKCRTLKKFDQDKMEKTVIVTNMKKTTLVTFFIRNFNTKTITTDVSVRPTVRFSRQKTFFSYLYECRNNWHAYKSLCIIGMFKKRSLQSRYIFMWDVHVVLNCMKNKMSVKLSGVQKEICKAYCFISIIICI